jgi:hypothetical protein
VKKRKKALEQKYDGRGFHDPVLKSQPVRLDVLEEQMGGSIDFLLGAEIISRSAPDCASGFLKIYVSILDNRVAGDPSSLAS